MLLEQKTWQTRAWTLSNPPPLSLSLVRLEYRERCIISAQVNSSLTPRAADSLCACLFVWECVRWTTAALRLSYNKPTHSLPLCCILNKGHLERAVTCQNLHPWKRQTAQGNTATTRSLNAMRLWVIPQSFNKKDSVLLQAVDYQLYAMNAYNL